MPGLKEGSLQDCPPSPNCVSSQAEPDDEKHHVERMAFDGDVELARRRLIQIVTAMPGTELVTEEPRYVHVTFTTRVLRFVDDVEFMFDVDQQTIEVRSASRVGHSDFGVNRRRVGKIRSLWMSQVR